MALLLLLKSWSNGANELIFLGNIVEDPPAQVPEGVEALIEAAKIVEEKDSFVTCGRSNNLDITDNSQSDDEEERSLYVWVKLEGYLVGMKMPSLDVLLPPQKSNELHVVKLYVFKRRGGEFRKCIRVMQVEIVYNPKLTQRGVKPKYPMSIKDCYTNTEFNKIQDFQFLWQIYPLAMIQQFIRENWAKTKLDVRLLYYVYFLLEKSRYIAENRAYRKLLQKRKMLANKRAKRNQQSAA